MTDGRAGDDPRAGAGLLEQAADARIPWTARLVREWYSSADLLAQTRAGLAQEVAWLADDRFAGELRGHAAPESAIPLRHWANRRLDLSGGHWAITGIRFRNRDNARPFVDVIATDLAPAAAGLHELVTGIATAYAAFRPLSVRVHAPDPDDLIRELHTDGRFGPGLAVDRYIVAGVVGELRARPRAAAYDIVRLEPGDAGRLARMVERNYASLYQENPRHSPWASPENEDSLAECAADGVLAEIRVAGHPAGVIATVRWDAHGMRGFSVQELSLDRAHRGRGLAAPATQRLLDVLPAQPDDALWGTIAPENLPSLRNALRIGRRVVGGTIWVTPPTWPGMPV